MGLLLNGHSQLEGASRPTTHQTGPPGENDLAVTGVVAYNQLAPVTETGLPTSTSTTIGSGSSVPITVTVTNTTNHVGLFELQSSAGDIR